MGRLGYFDRQPRENSGVCVWRGGGILVEVKGLRTFLCSKEEKENYTYISCSLVVVVVVLLSYVQGKHLRSCRDCQVT